MDYFHIFSKKILKPEFNIFLIKEGYPNTYLRKKFI